MVDDLDTVRRLEDAGAAAIVMHSLFEEQIVGEQLATHHHAEISAHSSPEALSYLPQPDEFRLGPEEYLDQVAKLKKAVAVPVIASLNGTTPGGWLEYATLMEEAGADALELNLYEVVTNPDLRGPEREARELEAVRAVVGGVGIPVAVKLSPFYSALPRLAREFAGAGARGLVVFNRFYQPDIDPEELEVKPTLRLSDPSELLLRLNWLAILSGQLETSLAVSGGVHSGLDAVKAIMAGAHGVQMVSALLRNGPEYLGTVREELAAWMEEHEYESIRQMIGSMNLLKCPEPRAFERGNYMRILQSWQGFA